MIFDLLLILGCIGFGLTIAYGWWSVIRDDLLRWDLIEIRSRLDRAMEAKGASDNPAYLILRDIIDLLGETIPGLSVFALLTMKAARESMDVNSIEHLSGNSQMDFVKPWVPKLEALVSLWLGKDVPEEVIEAKNQLTVILISYYLGSFSTWACFACMAVFEGVAVVRQRQLRLIEALSTLLTATVAGSRGGIGVAPRFE